VKYQIKLLSRMV